MIAPSIDLLGFAKLRVLQSIWLLAAVLAALPSPCMAQQASAAGNGATLFQNVRIFDGKSSNLSAASHVLVQGNVIERISTSLIAAEAGTRVIDGGGRVLMPGLIDVHWHAMMIRTTPAGLWVM